jgi:hypothetical protein
MSKRIYDLIHDRLSSFRAMNMHNHKQQLLLIKQIFGSSYLSYLLSSRSSGTQQNITQAIVFRQLVVHEVLQPPLRSS